MALRFARGWFVLWLLVAQTAGAQTLSRVVAVTGDHAPGTFLLTFPVGFGPRDFWLDRDGRVVFVASLIDVGNPLNNSVGYFTGTERNDLQLVALNGDPAPGGGTFDIFASTHWLQLSPGGSILIRGGRQLVGGPVPSLWAAHTGEPLHLALSRGSAAPGTDSQYFGFADLPVPFQDGLVLFRGDLDPAVGNVDSDTNTGLWSGGVLDPLAGLSLLTRENQAMPGQPPGAKFNSWSELTLAENGDAYWTANSKAGVSAFGLYKNASELVADRSQFGTITKVTVNRSGDLVFLGDTNVYRNLNRVTGAGDALPDTAGNDSGATLKRVVGYVLLDNGTIVLYAESSLSRNGIYRFPALGTPVRLVQVGDKAPGPAANRTFGAIWRVTANNNGIVAFEGRDNVQANAGYWMVTAGGHVKPVLLPQQTLEVGVGDLRTLLLVRGPTAASTEETYGTGADGRSTHLNDNNELLLNVGFSDFVTGALVIMDLGGLVVNSTSDDGDMNPGDEICDTGRVVNGVPECTLRAAIEEANATPGPDVIKFHIPVTDVGFVNDVYTISPRPGRFAAVATPMTIDATTQPGYAGAPVVVLDGAASNPTADDHGFLVTGDGSLIRGFDIGLFGGRGFHISGNLNTVEGCWIGVAADGVTPYGNGQEGVMITGGTGNRIGGSGPGEGNVIVNNGLGLGVGGSSGEQVTLDASDGNILEGNRVGTDAAGQNPLPNPNVGVLLRNGSTGNVIGGSDPGSGNVISGHAWGVRLVEAPGNTVAGNRIGLDAAGTAGIPNTRAGIEVMKSPNTTIGGLADQPGSPPGNVISGNRRQGGVVAGIHVLDGSHGTAIRGNVIGLDTAWLSAVGNGGPGILLEQVDSTRIGEFDERARNIIAGNDSSGVLVQGGTGTRSRENFIGTHPGLAVGLGNGGDGITIRGSDGNESYGDVVRGNNRAGVRVEAGVKNNIERSAFFANGDLGIDLGAPGPEAIDELDADAGANGLQNPPVLARAQEDTTAKAVRVKGSLHSAPNTTYRIAFYANSVCDASGFGEGEAVWVPDEELGTDAFGIKDFTFDLPLALAPGGGRPSFLTCTATDPAGNTSEFSVCLEVLPPDAGGTLVVNSPADLPDDNPGDGVCNTGGKIGGKDECTLRAAIQEANALAGVQTILFDLAGTGAHSIPLQGPLPAIEGPAIVDGRSQPGFQGEPVVTVHGASPSDAVIDLTGVGVTLEGLGVDFGFGAGVRLGGNGGHLVQGMAIGGIPPIPAPGSPATNLRGGIVIESDGNLVGGPGPVQGNRIFGNGGGGIRVDSGQTNTLINNGQVDNVVLGIDLVGGSEDQFGVTANDPGDADTGPNGLQNWPELGMVQVSDTAVLVSGLLSSSPNATFNIHVYASAACDGSGHGEGERYLGVFPVLTNGAGQASFAVELPLAVSGAGPTELIGASITATATDGPGSTSEFGNCVAATPVAVLLTRFTAVRVDNGVLLQWATGEASDHVGFHVYRREATSPGAGQRIDDALILGDDEFSYLDTDAARGVRYAYELEGISRDGSTQRFGPVVVDGESPPATVLRAARNPAFGSGAVLFSLTAPGQVLLQVLDVRGRLVRSLADGAFPAGDHTVTWDGRDDAGRPAASGTYLLLLEAPGVTRTSRITLLR